MPQIKIHPIPALITLTLLLLLAAPVPRAEALGQWINGTVTRTPWQDKYWRIEINGLKYTLMPEVLIRSRSNDGKGRQLLTPVPMRHLTTGKKVEARCQGFRIHEIILD